MVNTTEIQIFVSCPGDVEPEKNIVKDVCNRINVQLSTNSCSVRYSVKEWKAFIGQFGINPQENIDALIGNYDIYFGIWWMRFGSKTGLTNPITGEEFESGTHQEFVTAHDRWQLSQSPEIFLFFKKAIVSYEDEKSHEQYGKIIAFRNAQKSNGWFNEFETPELFKDKITDLLYGKALNICSNKKVEQKQEYLSTNVEFKIKLNFSVPEIPQAYIFRKTSHFLSVKEKRNNPFLQTEKQTLSELILKQNKIIVLGDAGSGKSTELRNLYFELSKDKSPVIPLYQQLNTYTPDQSIEGFLPSNWKEIPQNLLLVIWDGLDEIQPENFNTVIRQITTFIEKHPEAKFVISSRTNFYELPVNNSPGTLIGFEPYFLDDLGLSDVKNYFTIKYQNDDSEKFIEEVFDNNLEDIITKPFFLMLLASIFSESKKLSIKRADLYKSFLLSRFNSDESHFKGTVNIREKKEEIISLLEKVALSMEILTKNYIDESEILKIISSSEFITLKYCTAFKKKEGEENVWQFEHNNIQEYLAANVLSKLPFEKVIQFLTFDKPYNKLIPSWVNTLTFLFSVLNSEDKLFTELIKWLLENEKEIVVKFERDKISESIRNEIFQAIFNYYKSHDVWIRSNNFKDKDLSRFGESKTTIEFLLQEIKQVENTRTTKINALSLLGHFNYTNSALNNNIGNFLLDQIIDNIEDAEYVRICIYSLNYSELSTPEIIKSLIDILYTKTSEYIRSAIYSLLLKNKYAENYVDYLIEGYELLDSKNIPGRGDINLMDESWNLNGCIKNIKSAIGLKKLIDYISNENRFSHTYGSNEIAKAIVENAILAYYQDETLFENVFNWFLKDVKTYSLDKTSLSISFFNSTNTRSKAFHEMWSLPEDNERNKSFALSVLATKENLEYIITSYNSHDITNKDLEGFIHNLQWTSNESYSYFEDLIKKETTYQLNLPPRINYEEIRKRKQQEDFSLLFNFEKFKTETLKIFEGEKKTDITSNELFGIRKENGKYIELEDYYSGTALRLLKDLCRSDQIVNKEKTVNWFNKKKNIEWYTISLIYEHLSNNKTISVTETQKEFIKEWCFKTVNTFDFKTAITQNGESTSTKTIAIYLWFFSRTLNFSYSPEVLLDMLSFDYIEQHDFIGIDYLITQLDSNKISERISANLKQGIFDVHVLKNHIKYATVNKITETYPFIIKEITNLSRKYYDRNEILNIYFENTKDVQTLKNIIDEGDSYTIWAIVEILRVLNENEFLEPYLIKLLANVTDDNSILAAENLIMLQNIEGLKFYVQWLKTNPKFESDRRRISCLQTLKNLDALPHLIELLDLSYQIKIAVEPFEDLGSVVINALYNIALISESNFVVIKYVLEKFMVDNKDLYKNVNYLLHTISRLEQQFYMNKAQGYTIEQVKEKIKLIE